MKLTNAIVEHILTNLGCFDQRTNSLFSLALKTDLQLTYEDDGAQTQYDIYACETLLSHMPITIVGASLSSKEPDIAVVVHIKDCPNYGCYWNDSAGLIAYTLKENTWIEANTHIQASFLLGMEQLRDMVQPFVACKSPQTIHQSLISFLKYIDQINEIN